MLRIDGLPPDISPDIGFTGPGNVEFLDCTDPTACKVRLTTEGIYVFTVTAPGYDGNTYSAKIAVTVLDRAKLDALLKAKWEGMKAALVIGNIDEAVSYYSETSRASFRQQFAILSARLPEVAAGMGIFTFIRTSGAFSECDLRTIRNGKAYSFEVKFILDRDGVWRIMSY